MVRKNRAGDKTATEEIEAADAEYGAAVDYNTSVDVPAAPTKTWTEWFQSLVPTLWQAGVSAVLAALVAFGTSVYKDYSSAAGAGEQVAVALKTTGRDKVAMSNDADEAMLSRMASSCAISFSGIMASALQQCAASCPKPGKKG